MLCLIIKMDGKLAEERKEQDILVYIPPIILLKCLTEALWNIVL
jgi:hypothetical protein